MDTIVRIFIILPFVYLSFVMIMFTVNVVKDVFTVRPLNLQETAQAALRSFWNWSRAPFKDFTKDFTNFIREKNPLEIVFTPISGYTFTPKGGEKITGEFMQDRQQYSFKLNNLGRYDLKNVRLLLKFPYPIEQDEVSEVVKASGYSFEPLSAKMTVNLEGYDSGINVLRKPLSSNLELHIEKLESSGSIAILLLFNSWRDPRGKVISAEEKARYQVPQSGPKVTYISGTYNLEMEDPAFEYEFYAPISLSENKIISIGKPTVAPKDLVKSYDMQ